MDTTYELWDEGWTSGGSENCYGWTGKDIVSMANSFGVEVEIDPITGNVYEVSGDERKLIGTRD